MPDSDSLEQCEAFDWDENSLEKNSKKHRIAFWECEEVFLNEPLVVQKDVEHSGQEIRYYALGKATAGRRLFIVFTMRGNLIRVISARNMTRNEKKTFERREKENSSF